MEVVNPYEYHNNILGIQGRFLFIERKGRETHPMSLCLISIRGFQDRVSNGTIKHLRANAPGQPMLVEFYSLSYQWQKLIIQAFGKPEEQTRKSLFERNYIIDEKASSFYSAYTYGEEGLHLPTDKQEEYTINASVLNLVYQMREQLKENRRAKSMSITAQDGVKSVWDCIVADCKSFKKKIGHTLPDNADRLYRALSRYRKEGYAFLIHGSYGNKFASKVMDKEQKAFLDELISHPNNFDNEQIAGMYNAICNKMGWKTITASSVENRRKKISLIAFAGNHGEKAFNDKKSMLIKRSAPKLPMLYWTLDGWDAELLYQEETVNSKGQKVTVYHKRPTIVFVIDPCTKYPIGYAVGRSETSELIRMALKNALLHVKELFGSYYKPLQIQSDNWGGKDLKSLYKALTKHYTPAKVGNAKSKIVESYNKYFNKKHCQVMFNWSGFGVTSRKENQPNEDFKNLTTVKKQYPDFDGVCDQLHRLVEIDRKLKVDEYKKLWLKVEESDKLPMTIEQYLSEFGQTTGFTNRIEAMGLCPTIFDEKRTYDCFDSRFQNLGHVDWVVKFEPNDLSTVLAESKDGKHRFVLEEKYVQPMALAERKEGDDEKRKRVENFNKAQKEEIVNARENNWNIINDTFEENPALEETLAKMVLTDSKGQHKNNK